MTKRYHRAHGAKKDWAKRIGARVLEQIGFQGAADVVVQLRHDGLCSHTIHHMVDGVLAAAHRRAS